MAAQVGRIAPTLSQSRPTPGYGISYLGTVDFLLLYSLIFMTLTLLLPQSFTGRVQGIIGLVISLLGLLVVVIMIVAAITRLVLMVSLLLAPIFGTIAYFAIFADFDRTGAAATLGFIFMLKVVLAICLLFAHQRFLLNKSFVVLVALSIGLTLLVGFLQGFPPGFLASITDGIASLVIAIVALIWLIILLVGSIVAIVKAVV